MLGTTLIRIRRSLALSACLVLLFGAVSRIARGEFIIVDHVGAARRDSFLFSTTFSEIPDLYAPGVFNAHHSVAYDITWDESVSPGPQPAADRDVVLRLFGESADDLRIVVYDSTNWTTDPVTPWIELGSVPANVSDRTLTFEVPNDLIRDASGSFFLEAFATVDGATTNSWYGYVGPVPEPTSSTMLVTALLTIGCCRCRTKP